MISLQHFVLVSHTHSGNSFIHFYTDTYMYMGAVLQKWRLIIPVCFALESFSS